MAIPSITSTDELEDVLKSNVNVMIYFSAPWCAPCKEARKVLDQCIPKFPSVYFVEVKFDDSPYIVERCQVSGVPAFIAFKNGTPMTYREGRITVPKLEEVIQTSFP